MPVIDVEDQDACAAEFQVIANSGCDDVQITVQRLRGRRWRSQQQEPAAQ
jgi:hypothetical protein